MNEVVNQNMEILSVLKNIRLELFMIFMVITIFWSIFIIIRKQ